jgi:hypothetical protein
MEAGYFTKPSRSDFVQGVLCDGKNRRGSLSRKRTENILVHEGERDYFTFERIARKAVDISRKCANIIGESSLQALCPAGPRELSLGFFFFLHDQNGIPDRRL